jgi:peptidyl-prolyl cis-trans isomerase SurA
MLLSSQSQTPDPDFVGTQPRSNRTLRRWKAFGRKNVFFGVCGLTVGKPFSTLWAELKKLFAIFLTALIGWVPLLAAEATILNGIEVIVNGDIITSKEVNDSLADDIEFLRRNYRNNPKAFEEKFLELRRSRVEELVERHLILQEWEEYKKKGANIPESYFENRLQEEIKSYGDRLTLTKTLQAEGITFEQYKKRSRERIIVEIIMREKMPRDNDLIISPTKIQKYYDDNPDKFKLEDQVKLRMIVVTNQPADPSFSAEALAKEILAKIDEGSAFAEMAKLYSQGSQAAEGGSWNWVQRSVLAADLGQAAFSLKAGQHSGVIVRPDGAYIMLVEETKVAHVKPLSEVRDEIEGALKQQEKRRLRKQFVDRLKAKAYITSM